MKRPINKNTFNFFNYKWGKVPQWAKTTEGVYREWYLRRYGYKNPAEFKAFLKDKKTIVEAGCGGGRDSKFFAELAPHASVWAMDQSEHALKAASENLKPFSNAQVKWMDLRYFNHQHGFDFISCDQVLHHTPVPSNTIGKLFSALNPGGTFNFSVCRKKNPYRDLVDDLIMERAQTMTPDELWKFAEVVTEFGKALDGLNIKKVKFRGKTYDTLQRFVHDNVFRCWYRSDIDFQLSVSSNYDWFSNNPRFDMAELKGMISKGLNGKSYKVKRIFEDDATISVSLLKPPLNGKN